MRRKYVGRLSVGLFVVLFTLPAWQVASGQRPKGANVDPFGPPGAGLGAREPSEPRSTAATDQNSGTPQRSSRSQAAERIEHELSKTTELEVVEMPLKDCLLFFAEKHQIPILLNIKQLEEARIPADTPITKSLRGITLRSALNLMLTDLECAFVVKDEVLQITTVNDARRIFDVRIYDCRDLLEKPPVAKPVASAAVPPPPTESSRMSGGFGRAQGSEHEQRVAQLVALIRANVDPESWQGAATNGDGESALLNQPRGAVSEYDGLIVITQTARTHEQVERLLNLLREAARMETRPGRVAR